MSTQTQEPDGSRRPLHLVFGSGGSRAILAGIGFYLLIRQVGLTNLKSIGGVSGGSIVAALLSLNLAPSRLVKEAMEVDFSKLLTRHGSTMAIFRAYLIAATDAPVASRRPRKGVFSAKKIGQYIKSFSESWPSGYWTMAVESSRSIIFTEDAVIELKNNGETSKISPTAVDLSDAICGSCAIPGVLDAAVIQLEQRELVLFDGGLGVEGRCPASIPGVIYGADRGIVIALNVGDDTGPTLNRLRQAWRRIYRVRKVTPTGPREDGVILVEAPVTHIRSLQFDLNCNQKWQAIMIGYESAFHALLEAGFISQSDASVVRAVLSEFRAIQSESRRGQEDSSQRMEKLLSDYGVI